MIHLLRNIAILVAVVDQGSFRGAGKQLRLAPSRISQAVSDLENELGVTLLYRSTRQLSLTSDGKLLYKEGKQMLTAAENGLDAIRPTSSAPTGSLRVASPAFITQTDLMDTFAQFARTYPGVVLDLNFSDQRRDLIADGFDVGIRAGWLKDSELLARNIGGIERMLVAGPDYVASRAAAEHPSDLEEWDWIRFSVRPEAAQLESADGQFTTVLGKAHVIVDSADALFGFAVRNLGLAALPAPLASRACAQGELVHVLPEWTLKPLGIHAVWPDQSRRDNLTRLFVRFLADRASEGNEPI